MAEYVSSRQDLTTVIAMIEEVLNDLQVERFQDL